ncbi:MAG: cell division protein CrgA [Mycobacteriales bacterium]|nr:cell division protein CrgA [Frankia sp.]
MPKSRVRKKKKDAAYTPAARTTSAKRKHSPRWFGPLVLGLMLLGVAWLVVAYMTGATLPVQRTLGNWNVLIGFSLIAFGFGLATQWH